MKRPRGVSLIELIVVMTVATVVMGVAVGVLYTLMRIEGTTREHLRLRTAQGRLGQQFRRDVHAAISFTTPDGEAGGKTSGGWELQLAADRVVRYRVEEDKLVRTEAGGGDGEARESFALGSDATVTIRIEDDSKPTIVSLLIARGDEAVEPSAAAAVRVDAVLARDHRFREVEEP